MNKKSYIQPNVEETVVRMDAMILAGSQNWSDDEESGTDNLHDEDAIEESLSRRHTSLWDE